MKIIDYKICLADNTIDLEEYIKDYIDIGYVPKGGICMSIHPNSRIGDTCFVFYQAVVQYKEDNKIENNKASDVSITWHSSDDSLEYNKQKLELLGWHFVKKITHSHPNDDKVKNFELRMVKYD